MKTWDQTEKAERKDKYILLIQKSEGDILSKSKWLVFQNWPQRLFSYIGKNK